MRKRASTLVSGQPHQSFHNCGLDWYISDAKYRVQDYKVPVEGGEITVRAVIPDTRDEGKKYPLLFWTHGGGQFSLHNLVFLFICCELMYFLSPFQD
jgi:hypothetical protein